MFTQDGQLQLREYKNLIRDRNGDHELVTEITDHVHRELTNENAFGFRGGDPWTQSRITERARELRFEFENGIPANV